MYPASGYCGRAFEARQNADGLHFIPRSCQEEEGFFVRCGQQCYCHCVRGCGSSAQSLLLEAQEAKGFHYLLVYGVKVESSQVGKLYL